jgi:outer membrane receptor for ferric coprogen and ferric-rhodotorulic acid
MFKRPLSTQKPLYLAMQIIFLSSTAMLSITHANTVEEEEANATSQPNAQLATITLTAKIKQQLPKIQAAIRRAAQIPQPS